MDPLNAFMDPLNAFMDPLNAFMDPLNAFMDPCGFADLKLRTRALRQWLRRHEDLYLNCYKQNNKDY